MSLPEGVQVTETGDGVLYTIPLVRVGISLGGGCGLIVFLGLMAFVGFCGCFGGGIFTTVASSLGGAIAGTLVGFLIGAIILGLCGFLLFLALYSVMGVNEIRITKDRILSTYRVGPLRWSGSRLLAEVRQLQINHWGSTSGSPELGSLSLECRGRRSLSLLFGYPREWVEALAEDVSRRPPWVLGAATVLPVETTTATTGTSLGWQPRSRVMRLVPILFFLPFLISGGLLFPFMISTLIAGDPNNQLQGDVPWKYLWLLFPLPFFLVGLFGTIYNLRQFFRTPVSPEALAIRPATMETQDAIRDNTTEWPYVPEHTPETGQELTYRLSLSNSPKTAVFGLIIALIVCSGVLTPIFMSSYKDIAAGRIFRLDLGFGLCFGGVLLAMFVYIAFRLFQSILVWRMGDPTVEVSAYPVRIGQSANCLIRLPRKQLLEEVRVAFRCEESATFTQGTDTRTETRTVHEAILFEESTLLPDPDQEHRIRTTLTLPQGVMHSFEATKNKVRWQLVLEGKFVGFLKMKFQFVFPITVVP